MSSRMTLKGNIQIYIVTTDDLPSKNIGHMSLLYFGLSHVLHQFICHGNLLHLSSKCKHSKIRVKSQAYVETVFSKAEE